MPPLVDSSRLNAALEIATRDLLAARAADSHWEGELSSSALSTATAVTALALASKHGTNLQSSILNPQSSINSGLQWLSTHANSDGGWGDTAKSLSNLSTTTLCWAAFGAVADADTRFASTVRNAEQWIAARIGVPHSALRTSHSALAQAIIARYGNDRTFSVPILTMCALAGRLGPGPEAWQHVIPLPFELAACPHQLFAALRLPVVSYALPALIAIGQARHVHAPTRNPFARFVRNATRDKTLRVLAEIQPSNGGFLEATPLTSFVTMSLAASGQPNHIVTRRGVEFLLKSQRADGSWPIDTNLATWCTTLAIDAFPQSSILNPQSSIDWLLAQQYRTEHPYTHAAPGGWAWTNLPGGVPDADDTAGALIALAKLQISNSKSQIVIRSAAESGIRWLLDLQNRDGGIPTFCRGWGALPFDRSSADITAHAIRAWQAWQDEVSPPVRERIARAIRRTVEFLANVQSEDGSWSPLWFGNQLSLTEENLTYGTARVVRALAELPQGESKPLNRGTQWLINAQHPDGSWSGVAGGPSSVEETALATEALACAAGPGHASKAAGQATMRGAKWLVGRVESGEWKEASPIGFYFAKLWYYECLYPMIFTVGALRAAVALSKSPE